MRASILILICGLFLTSCNSTAREKRNNKEESTMNKDSTSLYGFNREFLKKHIDVIELRRGNSALSIVPEWQARVMTSTSEGDKGFSFGWINHELISSGRILPHINAFGGEERLWLGPEGGQYSIFFEKGKEFSYENWQTPAFLDTLPFELKTLTDTSAIFGQEVETVNYSGTPLNIKIEREISILSEEEILNQSGVDISGVNCVAYRSVNIIINKGKNEWKKETGLISVWMLGMFTPSPSVVVAIPFIEGDEKILGPAVNDDYFGSIPADRLSVSGNHIFFRADGKSRGKIGIPPLRATGAMGSFDSENKILTLLICKLPEGVTDYVNSSWQIQDNPYSGDALNSYNDGPLEDGSQMGPFYELETSSPAAALKSGESLTHTQVTLHITGDRDRLNAISEKALGVSLDIIERAFNTTGI